MPITISKTEIASFVGDVLPLYLVSDTDLTKADVTWEIEGDAAVLRRFDDSDKTPFSYGVLVTLQAPGTATVKALFEGKTYTCEVHVRERCHAPNEEATVYLRGDLHVHPSHTHKPDIFAATPHLQADCISQIKEEALLDFSVLSDHACVMHHKGFFDSFVEKELAEPMEPVLFPSSESEVTVIESDRFGHKHQHSGELVLLNADNCSFGERWEELYERMAQSPEPVGIFAHPFVLGPYGFWSFPFDRIREPALYRMMRGIELGNGSQSNGGILYEYAYSQALDNGFSVSPTCGSDRHGPTWGFGVMTGKTIVMAADKSRESILDSLRSNRFYASESGNVKLHYTVNGQIAPTRLTPCNTYTFDVRLGLFEEDETTLPTHCQVISDGGSVILSCDDFGRELHFTLRSDTARYFYLRLWDDAGRKTWSSPVWTGRAFDEPVKESPLIPLDGCDFSAYDEVTGADASAVLDSNPSNPFQSTAPTASIVIDMKKPRDICALGHWGAHISKLEIKAAYEEWKPVIGPLTVSTASGYTIDYAISTSEDGITYTPRAKGFSRALADEEIIRFPAHRARFVKFEVLSTLGRRSGIPALADAPVNVGVLTLFTE